METYNCKSVPEFIDLLNKTVNYLEKKNASNLGDLFTASGKKVNAGMNNYTIIAKEYHESLGMGNYQAQPWCDMYVSTMFAIGFGLELGKKLCEGWYSYVQTHKEKFDNIGRKYKSPKVGDIVFFWSNSLGRYGHTGIVVGVDSDGIGFTTVEGNTTSGNDIVERNGGAIARKHYSSRPSNCVYGRPRYEENGISLTAISPEPPKKEIIEIASTEDGLEVLQSMVLVDDNDKFVAHVLKGDIVHPKHKKYKDGITMFWVEKDNQIAGWCIPKHCIGWICEVEDDDQWWRLEDNYTWPTEAHRVVDGLIYAFNGAGYMIDDEEVVFKSTSPNGNLVYARTIK